MSDNEDDDRLSNVVFPRKLLKNFMVLYKDLPCLWDKNCAAYKTKHRRHEAVTQLTELVRRHDPTATRVHVLRKIESLRACVRREHKRVRDSRMKAKTPDDVYKPSLWYYNLLSFLFTEDDDCFYDYNQQDGCKEDNQNEESDEDNAQAGDEDGAYDRPETYTPRGATFMFGRLSPGFSSDMNVDSSLKRKVPYRIDNNGLVVSPDTPIKQFSGYDDGDCKAKRLCTEVDDEYDAIGVNVAAKLRSLPSNMRILAEKLINDVIFQAQLNGLTPSTTITTPDPFKQDPL